MYCSVAVCEHKLLFCVGGHQRRWNLCRVPMMIIIIMIIMIILVIMIIMIIMISQKRILKIR